MCVCTPTRRTPWYGAPGCERPPQPEIPCQHLNFHVRAEVARLADDNRPLRFMASLGIECVQCHTVFEFDGIDFHGMRLDGPSLGVFGYPLSIPIKPAEQQPRGPYMTEELREL